MGLLGGARVAMLRAAETDRFGSLFCFVCGETEIARGHDFGFLGGVAARREEALVAFCAAREMCAAGHGNCWTLDAWMGRYGTARRGGDAHGHERQK